MGICTSSTAEFIFLKIAAPLPDAMDPGCDSRQRKICCVGDVLREPDPKVRG